MSRPLKILLAAVAALVVLVLGIAVAALLLVDPNEYRGEIAAAVEEQTGRTFSIDGDIGLRVLPCCAVAIDDTRLGNPPGFEAADFASVAGVRLGLQLWPLLFRQRVVVDEVTLDELSVNLVRRADGVANWSFDTGAADTDVPAEPATIEPGDADLPGLSVAGVRITDASIELRDETSGTHFVVEDLDVETGPVAVGEPIDVDISLRARDLAGDASIRAALETGLLLQMEESRAELTGLVSTVTVTSPDLPDDGMVVKMQGAAVKAALDSGAVDMEDLVATISVAGVKLEIRAAGTLADEQASLSGTLAVAEFSLRDALAALGQSPVETSDPDVLGAVSLDADWRFAGERIDVQPLNLHIDDSRVTGSLDSGIADPAATVFDLEIDAIDLDRYLAPAPEDAAQESGAAVLETQVPVEPLRDLDVDGRIAVGRLTVGGLVLENVVGRVNAADGVIGIDPSSADVYGGRYEGAVQLDVRGDVPKLSVAQSLGAVQTGGMLADLYGTENLQGLLQARIDGSGSGRTAGELLQDLSGSVALDLDDAVYKGADLWYEIRRTVARIKGKPLPAAPTDPQTQITALGFAGRLADGALQSERLVAEIPFIRVEGGGVFDLLQNRLDYRLKARMLSRPNFPDADDLADLERVTIPVTVTGDAADPKIGIDLESLAKDAAVQKVQDRLLKKLGLDQPDDAANTGNDATDQGDDARESLKKGLRDLFRP